MLPARLELKDYSKERQPDILGVIQSELNTHIELLNIGNGSIECEETELGRMEVG